MGLLGLWTLGRSVKALLLFTVLLVHVLKLCCLQPALSPAGPFVSGLDTLASSGDLSPLYAGWEHGPGEV